MSMIKKICALDVSIILIFSFTACGTDSAQTAPAEEVTKQLQIRQRANRRSLLLAQKFLLRK